MCGFKSKETRNAEMRELLGLELISYVVKEDRVKWFRLVEYKDDAVCVICQWTLMEQERGLFEENLLGQRGYKEFIL